MASPSVAETGWRERERLRKQSPARIVARTDQTLTSAASVQLTSIRLTLAAAK